MFVPHSAGKGGGDGGWNQAWHPPGQIHFLLHLLIPRRSSTGGGNEEVGPSCFLQFTVSDEYKTTLVLFCLCFIYFYINLCLQESIKIYFINN